MLYALALVSTHPKFDTLQQVTVIIFAAAIAIPQPFLSMWNVIAVLVCYVSRQQASLPRKPDRIKAASLNMLYLALSCVLAILMNHCVH